jgi:hypothetical protein
MHESGAQSATRLSFGATFIFAIHKCSHRFADDTSLFIDGEDEFDVQYKIINVVRDLEIWFQTSNLIRNTEKTFAMPFH